MPSRPPPRFWIVSPKSAARVAGRSAGNDLEWCYLGTDVSQRERVAKGLASARRVAVSEELTRLAYEVKQPFLDWIADMGRHQQDPLIWWGSTLASKSPLQTDVFLLVCYARLVDAWVRQGGLAATRLVVVENPWLAQLLRSWYAHEPQVTVTGWTRQRCLLDAARWIRRIPPTVAHTILWSAKEIIATRTAFRAAGGQLAHADRPIILLYTWIEQRCFATPGQLVEPWTGRLQEILAARGERVGRLTALDIPSEYRDALRPFAPALIITPQHLRLRDIACALAGWFRIDRLKVVSQFEGRDYSPLFLREQLQEWGRGNFWQYRLLYFAMRRIARQWGSRVSCVIYPFENQPWEKLFCLAWREQAPHVRLVGYQHSWVPSLLLPYFLGKGERNAVPLPDHIVANSTFNLQVLRDGGYAPSSLVNGGALRHEYLLGQRNGGSLQPRHNRRGRPDAHRVILVTFPLLAPHAGSLFVDLVEEFRTPLRLGDGTAPPVQFILKCHPRLPIRAFYSDPVTLPPWITVSQEPMSRMLPEADLLLYVGPTSSWWEALLSGVPVLKYCPPDLLDIDAGHTLDGVAVHTCARATLRSTLTALLRDAPPQRPPDARVLGQLFSKVNEELWVDLVAGKRPFDVAQAHPEPVEGRRRDP